MMKRVTIILLFFSFSLYAQNWAPLGKGFDMGRFPRTMVIDSANNRLIFGGDFKWINSDSTLANGICTWDGVKWDSLGYSIQECPSCNTVDPVSKLYWYKNTLYADGHFSCPGLPFHHGKFNPVTKSWENIILCADINGTWQGWSNTLNSDSLVISGIADTVCGLSKSIGFFYDGASFYPAPLLTSISNYSGNVLRYFFKYKNTWYITGALEDPVDSASFGFARYNGNHWEAVPGFTNCPGFTSIKKYNNELYMTGPFYKKDGAPGNAIVKFDGTTWDDLGGGMYTITNNPDNQVSWFSDFTMHKGELYATGFFYYKDSLPEFGVVKFDGHTWCNAGDAFDNEVFSIDFWNDTLYIAGAFNHAGSQVIRGAAKYTGTGFLQCDATTVNEMQASARILKIYPNPATSYITIEADSELPEKSAVQIQNYLGQIVLTAPYEKKINISSLSEGCYFILVKTTGKGIYHSKFIKR